MASGARIYIDGRGASASADGYQGAVTQQLRDGCVGTRLPFMVFERWT